MPTIGETLRDARMRQRLDIADVEARTKIRAKYLRALENEEFALLPGSTFVKTFLRTYAELLGLDPHRLVEEYRTNYEPDGEHEIQPLGSPAVAGQREPRRGPPGPPNRLAVLAGAVGIVLVFLIVLGVTGDEEENGGNGVAGRTETEKRNPRPKPKPKPRPRPTLVTLRIAPAVPTYACLDKGPGTEIVFEGNLEEPRAFKARKLRVNLGKTSAILTVNGRRLRIEPSPNPVGYEFSPTGTKPIPPEQRPCV
jgi:cytoskeleton protein RodZ